MADKTRRHKNDTKTWAELTPRERNSALNARIGWVRKAAIATARTEGPAVYENYARRLEREAARTRTEVAGRFTILENLHQRASPCRLRRRKLDRLERLRY